MKTIALLAVTSVLALSGCASSPSRTDSSTLQSTTCRPTDEREIAGLFDRWDRSLQTGDSHKVVANYAARSILLPTMSNKPRLTIAEKEDYFDHFLESKPFGKIDMRFIVIGCNSAVDAGLYTFTFGTTGAKVPARYTFTYAWDGKQWLITSHHSSAMPEKSDAADK